MKTVHYRRARFGTRLPTEGVYCTSHWWLREAEDGLWHVGLTGFATRMLGELVEYEFRLAVGDPLEVGQSIGWIEGFKATSDIFCAASGTFGGTNPALDADVTLMDRDPCIAGWLYSVRGVPDPAGVDVHAYVGILDATIDQMLKDNPTLANE